MANLFGCDWTRDALLDRVEDMAQLAGARRGKLTEGNEAGTEWVEMWNSSGLSLTVLPGRCLDIAQAQYNGIPLCFRGSTGDLSPAHYEPAGFGWLRGYFAGLLTTCGFTFVGHPETDAEEEGTELGLHGRATFIPARRVGIDEGWQGDEYTVSVSGRIRETATCGTNLELTRSITLRLGEKALVIRDRIENLSRRLTSPLMIVYHCNAGFPIVNEGARVLLSAAKSIDTADGAEVDGRAFGTIDAPSPDNGEAVYVHTLNADSEDAASVAIVNDKLGDGLGVYWKYNSTELPVLSQWTHFVSGSYVVGIEPGNCSVMGRQANRDAGTLEHIAPGEVREFTMEIGVLDGPKEIAAFEDSLP